MPKFEPGTSEPLPRDFEYGSLKLENKSWGTRRYTCGLLDALLITGIGWLELPATIAEHVSHNLVIS